MPPEKQAHIFEEFVQGDSSHARRYEGTGLGLAISRRIVDAMNGTISVTSGENTGSVFTVLLPFDGARATHSTGTGALAGKRAVVLSSSPELRAGLKMQIVAAGGQAIEAKSLDTLRRIGDKCDVVLFDAGVEADVRLPNVSAFRPPFMALLAPQQRAQVSTLAAKGFAGYLTKPVRQSSLERRVAALLADEAEAAPIVAPQPRKPQAARPLAILLAEDNPVNALLARELLRRRGHAVHEVTTGGGAVAACGNSRFDLVIMDVHMPGLDGIEADAPHSRGRKGCRRFSRADLRAHGRRGGNGTACLSGCRHERVPDQARRSRRTRRRARISFARGGGSLAPSRQAASPSTLHIIAKSFLPAAPIGLPFAHPRR